MIKSITIRGERRSGTNWLAHVLGHTNCELNINDRFGWKHGYFESEHYSVYNSSDLIIVIFKDIYSWLLSFNADPRHMPWAERLQFGKFLRHEHYSIATIPWFTAAYGIGVGSEILRDRDLNGVRFKNVIQLRNAK
ncbi:MAG: hypothetical protein KAS32_15805, partial [Candidatus Peribacteraceae bacterium]|nr:hypothetical protein [Candidatus Peribacteraceae bacterium]